MLWFKKKKKKNTLDLKFQKYQKERKYFFDTKDRESHRDGRRDGTNNRRKKALTPSIVMTISSRALFPASGTIEIEWDAMGKVE